MIIIVDAMGGDNAPSDIVKGCIDAVIERKGFEITLLGDEKKINRIINENDYSGNRICTIHTSEQILNDDMPTKAIKNKKDSSMVTGLNMLKEGNGDVFISAGNTGALMTGALLIVGRIKGIDRPALAPLIPTKKGAAMIIDAGLNTVCKPINFQQFAIIGSIYMKEMYNIKEPIVGLINVGTEETKGNETVRQAHSILSSSNINFVGNIEGRCITEGKVDVVVCDGFVGNVLLKFLEGVGSFIFGELMGIFKKNIFNKISASLLKKDIKKFSQRLNYEEYGGTPILGINGIVVKCHGSSSAKTIKNTIFKSYTFSKTSFIKQIEQEFINMEVEDVE